MGGCSYSMENMLKSVKEDVAPVILFRDYGMAYDYFHNKGYQCEVVPFKLNIIPRNFNYLKRPFRLVYDTLFNLVARHRVKSIIDKYSIAIIHSNTSVMTFGIETALCYGLKHVWHFREFQDLDFGMKPFCGMKKFTEYISRSDMNIAISEAIANHWNLQNSRGWKIIRNAVRSASEVYYEEEKEKFVLFCSALLIKSKGADVAVDIFAQSGLPEQGYKLFFVGKESDASFMTYLRQKIQNYGLSDSIEFWGYQSDVCKYMRKASAFLMCSENEAMGRVTVEAMFYGCPILCNNAGGTKEFVKNGYNGYLYDSPEEAALLLRNMVEDGCRTLVENAGNTAIQEFSTDVYGKKMLDVYKNLLQ